MACYRFTILVVLNLAVIIFSRRIPYKCERVETPLCNNLDKEGYALTSFPNFLNHTTQDQAIFQLESYRIMLEATHAPELTMFMCSVYVPLCVHGIGQLPPCRSLCENSKKRIKRLLKIVGVKWPFNCLQFPVKDTGKLCMSGSGNNEKKVSQNNVAANKKAKHVVGYRGKTLHLQCAYNKKIHIRKIRYHPHNAWCCTETTKAIISNSCDGTNKCSFHIKKNMFDKKCSHKTKQYTGKTKVSLKFKCVSSMEKLPTRKYIPPCKTKAILFDKRYLK